MTSSDQTKQVIDKAEELRDDLVAIASSDLPFASDAERILEDLEKHREELED